MKTSVFSLISDSEGLPLSALEAMSSELPIILSDVGGCFELIDENGILVKNNVNEMTQIISLALNLKREIRQDTIFISQPYSNSMKRLCFFFIFACVVLHTLWSGNGCDPLSGLIQIEKKKNTIYELLNYIGDVSGYYFIYDSKIIDNEKKSQTKSGT